MHLVVHARHRRPARTLALVALAGILIAGTPAGWTAVADASTQETGLREFALTKGHIDLFDVQYDSDAKGLSLRIKDDSALYAAGTHFREPEDVSIIVDTEMSRLEIPEEMPPGFEFLGEPGDVVYHLPFTQDDALPWPGWSTERLLASLPSGSTIPQAADAVTLTLDVDGPGELHTWMEGSFGNVINRYVDTTDATPDVIPIANAAHVHTAWAFTEPGEYTITVTPRAKTTNAILTGEKQTYHFFVGNIPAPMSIATPIILGTPAVGSVLEVDAGQWNPRPHGTRVQWFRAGVAITGATSTTYVPKTSDDGLELTARVTARIGEAEASETSGGVTVGDLPADRPTFDDTTPVPGPSLTEATRGEITIIADEVERGAVVRIGTGGIEPGQWLSVWSQAGPQWLGWVQVTTAAQVAVRVPIETPAGDQRLAVKDRQGQLLGWDSVRVDPPAPPPPPEQPPVQAPPSQCTGGAAVLSSGHVDYASLLVDGQLQSLVGDDTSGSKVYREPSGFVLWLKPEAKQVLPGGYEGIGPAGTTVWQVPLTQNPNLIWLGWNTETLNASVVRGSVAWTLDSIDGPGAVTVYLSGAFGGVQQVILDGAGSRYDIPLGVHAHAAWAFRAEGVYRLTMTQRATLADGAASSDTETLTIVVGDVDPGPVAAGGSGCGVIPASALATATAQGQLLAAPQSGAVAAVRAADREALTVEEAEAQARAEAFAAVAASPVPLMLGILGGVFILGAAGSTFIALRRRP